MTITTPEELEGMKRISEIVAQTLKQMRIHARPGMSTKALDEYGGQLLAAYGARSAPMVMYNFPGFTCISVNQEVAHGVPSEKTILQDGDLINIDVSAELDGYFGDNGGSFVLGEDKFQHEKLVQTSKAILHKAIHQIRGGVKIAEIGRLIETEAKKAGFTVIKNLTGHGIGRKLHEAPREIANFYDRFNREHFKKNSVVALETFISTKSTYANPGKDGWTLTGNQGGFVAQHEHTLLITEDVPVIFTTANGIWD